VPSTPLARIAGFSQIASSIFFGTIKDKVTGVFATDAQEPKTKEAHAKKEPTTATTGASAKGKDPSHPVLGSFLSEANTERLAEGLCRMRGAALKVGQMLSIQDESLVPPQLQAVLDRVRDGADVMPRHQLEKALQTELGMNWQDSLSEFDWTPMAAASIGQVHRARLKSNGQEIVMKVQYPGVAESINSDVNNLKRLIRFVNVLPKGPHAHDRTG
jgi:aarF domain-containing kinase